MRSRTFFFFDVPHVPSEISLSAEEKQSLRLAETLPADS